MNALRLLFSFSIILLLRPDFVVAGPLRDFVRPTLTGFQIPHLDKIQEMIDAGVVRIGDLDLVSLRDKFLPDTQNRPLTVVLNKVRPTEFRGSDRKTGKNIPEDVKVYINLTLVYAQQNRSSNDNPTFYFHEYLGALGYNDRNYQISSVMTLTYLQVHYANKMSQYPYWRENLEKWQNTIANLKFDQLKPSGSRLLAERAGGGSTTTGGGGDYGAATYKSDLLHALFLEDEKDQFTKFKSAMFHYLLNLKVEVDWNNHYTTEEMVSLRGEGPNAVLWIPPNFTSEMVAYKFSHPSRPFTFLRRVIKPLVRKGSCEVMLE